ncbi:MAG: SGNH hydrolase domain-containing protein, partial [Actinomycetota bacterium]
KIFECEIGLSRQTEWSTILETSRLLTLNYPDNEFIDPTPTICPNRYCRAKVDGDWVFSDSNHLSPTGSRMLTPEYIKAIKKILLNR